MTAAPFAPAATSTYLARRLTIVQGQVDRAVQRRRADDPDPDDRFRGLYVSDMEVDELLGRAVFGPSRIADDDLRREIEDLDVEFERLAAADGDLELHGLADRFGLDAVDVQLLLVAMAPDVDPRFERLYGYLNDDVTLRRATIGLAMELSGVPSWSGVARARLHPMAPLAANGLMEVSDPDRPFLTRALRVPDRVVAHLLGDDRPDPVLTELAVPAVPVDFDEVGVLEAGLRAGARVVYVEEAIGGAGRSYAAAALEHIGWPIISIDLARLDPLADVDGLAVHLAREANLVGGAVVAGPIDVLAERGTPAVRALAELRAPVILIGGRSWDPRWSRELALLLDAPTPVRAQRAQLWLGALGERDLDPALDPVRATQQFRLSPEQIHRAAGAARRQATAHSRPVMATDLRAGARAQNAAGLERLARRVEPVTSWDDLVLPTSAVVQLRELVGQVRGRERVYDDWGMGGAAASRGRGVKALFAGDSGTGKTVSAEAIAQELGLDMYVIDLSTVVDKYVGETEKNLDRIFDEADRVNGVLLFDEADALFGKRSEVKDAHDRYANVEVAYLLQRMELFDGLAVLTSNLRSNLDEAFSRRLDAIIDFPSPDEEDRLRLWRIHLKESVPRGDDIDLEFLADAFELTGGNIRNVCLAAAFLAADEDRPVAMADLIRGTEREYRKLGRLVVASEFGPYFDLIAVRWD